MPAMQAVDRNSPLWKAWQEWKAGGVYTNAAGHASVVIIKIAPEATGVEHPHLEGSLWAAFLAGWLAYQQSSASST